GPVWMKMPCDARSWELSGGANPLGSFELNSSELPSFLKLNGCAFQTFEFQPQMSFINHARRTNAMGPSLQCASSLGRMWSGAGFLNLMRGAGTAASQCAF